MIERDSLGWSPYFVTSRRLPPKFELYRIRSQTLTSFRLRKLAMSLSGRATEIRTHVIDGMPLNEIRA